jgi:uncharacterized protein YbjT (DUF2867 family)
MILVVGATGRLGGTIVKKLLAKGKQVRIMVRENSPSESLARQGLATSAVELVASGAQTVTGDLRERASLDRACQGVDTVITTANTVLREFDLEGVDFNGNVNLIEAAKAARVNHFIFTSTSGSDPNSPDPLMQFKGKCDHRLQTSGLTYTILKPSLFMEVWVAMTVGLPLQAGQPITLVGKGDHRHNFVSQDDVADYAVAAVDNPAARNAEIFIGGSASYSWIETVRVIGDTIGAQLPLNFVAPGSPIPLLPEGMWGLLYAMETYESHIDMAETSKTYAIAPTSLETFARRFFVR